MPIPRPVRAIRDRNRLGPRPPKGTSHVIQYELAWDLPDLLAVQGVWTMQTLANWEAGTFESDSPGLEGPADITGSRLTEFASRELGVGFIPRLVRLTRFEIQVCLADGNPIPEWHSVPCYYVTPR